MGDSPSPSQSDTNHSKCILASDGSHLFRPEEGEDDHLQTDIILRTSDGLSFYVHKLILSQASPFFRSMFRLPQPQVSEGSGSDCPTSRREPPSIDLQEPSETWNRILQLLYPVPDPLFTALEQVKPVLEAARKYDLETVADRLQQTLLSPQFVEEEPLRVYAVACCYQLEDLAKAAARFTLRHPVLGPYVAELDDISASMYHRLLEYRSRCVKAAVAVATVPSLPQTVPFISQEKALPWMPRTGYVFFWGEHPCTCTPFRGLHYQTVFGTLIHRASPAAYWKELMDRAADALQERPCGATVMQPSIIAPALEVAMRCELCRPKAYTDITSFAEHMAAQIDKVVSEVKLEVAHSVYV